jgi:hypothetical protein
MAARPATLVDKLSLILPVVVGLPVGLLRLATRPFTNDVKPQTAYKDFVYAVFRHVLARVTITQEKWLTVPTEKTYLTWAEKKSLPTDTAILASGVKVHWIGEPSSEKVFLYFHGGGYVNPITPEHLDWLLELQTDLSKTKNVAVAVLGYTCAPEGQYPVQLREGAESLLWLLNARGKKPENVSHVEIYLVCHILTDLPYADIHRWRLSRWQHGSRSVVSHLAPASQVRRRTSDQAVWPARRRDPHFTMGEVPYR